MNLRLLTLSALAAACFGPGARLQAQYQTDSYRHPDAEISNINKASKLIGMQVKNRQNENLGRIHDIVIDVRSERVPYAVIDTSGLFQDQNRFVAAPISAFIVGDTKNDLILPVDRNRLERAHRFAENNWPDLNDRVLLADWRDLGLVRTDRDLHREDYDRYGRYDRDHVYRSDLDRYDRGRYETDYDSTYRPHENWSNVRSRDDYYYDRDSRRDRYRTENVFRGRITAFSPENRTMTIEGESGTRDFVIEANPTLITTANRSPSLMDFKVGYWIEVGYHRTVGGTYIAHSLNRTDETQVK